MKIFLTKTTAWSVGLLFLVVESSTSFQAVPSQSVRNIPVVHTRPNLNPSHHRLFRPKESNSFSSSSSSTTTTTTALSTSALSIIPSIVSNNVPSIVTMPVVKRVVLAMAATLMVIFRRRILWPGSGPDNAFPNHPLPKGSNGCPFAGSNVFAGDTSYGSGVFFTKLFKRLGRPKLFRFYSLGLPFVSVTGKEAIQDVLKNEFMSSSTPGKKAGVGTIDYGESMPNLSDIFGNKSVLYENDRDKHSFLRRLVGSAMTPSALKNAVPAVECAARFQVDKIVDAAKMQDVITMHTICNDFTLDVAWRQILGLDLQGDEEINQFYEDTRMWMNGVFSPIFMIPFKMPLLRQTKTYKAKERLVRLIEKKLDALEEYGPDDSTLSKMYYATDEDGKTRLSHEELIHNALILILAGSETSSSTLVNAMLFLGLHKDVLYNLQEEQRALIAKYGPSMSKDRLDNECPYLDAFIRETLRIRPLPSMEVRQTQETIIMDGQQIPKKNYVFVNVRATHDQDPSVRANDNDDHMDLIKGFKPERWLDRSTTPQDWMPFGMGARHCLGERLAMMEMKLFLATFVRNINDFDIEGLTSSQDEPNIKWKPSSAIPYPDDGVVIRPVVHENNESDFARAETSITLVETASTNSTLVAV